MGTGWRRAFRTNTDKQQQQSSSFEFSISEPCTPALRCRTTTSVENIKVVTPKSHSNSPRGFLGSNQSSPRSPFAILKNLRLSRSSSCGVCMQSVKKTSTQRMAVYTAECSHVFHFHCIASHLRKQNALICPVCNTIWKQEFPLLKLNQEDHHAHQKPMVFDFNSPKSNKIPISSPKYCPQDLNVYYTDDEPLVTPKASPKSLSIQKLMDYDEEEEEEEFQGFFVNPISSSIKNELLESNNVQISILPEAAAVISMGQTHDTYAVVLKIKAPQLPPAAGAARRAPIDLVTVLDVSSSMNGAKLEMMKRAMRLVISSLGSADRLSIVVFSDTPTRLIPLTRMTAHGQKSARRIIDRLACSHGRSVTEALNQAAKILSDRRERNPVATIILLSDSQNDTVCPTTTTYNNNQYQQFGSKNASSTRFAHVEIPVQSSGSTRDPVEDGFTKCVGELLSVVVQDLEIQLRFAPGSDPAEIMAVYSCTGRPKVFGSDLIRLGDLYAEEERELLVEIRAPKLTTFGSQSHHHVFSTRCCYRNPAKIDELIHDREQTLLVPRPQIPQLDGSSKIGRLRNAFISTRAIAESRQLIEHNEMANALPLLSSARDLLLQSRTPSAMEYVKVLEAEITEVLWRKQNQLWTAQMKGRQRTDQNEMVRMCVDRNAKQLTPRASEKLLAKVTPIKNSFRRVSDLHGFENARF